MNVLIIDLETSIKNTKIGKMRASPYHPGNCIIATGYQINDEDIVILYKQDCDYGFLKDIDLVVAHNAAFELTYLQTRHPTEWKAYLERGGKVWCTQIVEYLLSNLTHQFPTLDATCVRYGGKLKNSRVKEYWDNGIDTEDIPSFELLPYLEEDVRNTKLTYKGQLKKAEEFGMLPIIEVHMKALIALVDMSMNGMKFDIPFAREEADRLSKLVTKLKETASKFMQPFFVEEVMVNPSSDQQIGAVLFGGTYKYKKLGTVLDPYTGELLRKKEFAYVNDTDEDGNPILFKSGAKKGEYKLKKIEVEGELKYKLYEYSKQIKGLGIEPQKEWFLEKSQSYSVGKKVLTSLLDYDILSIEAREFILLILEIRKLDKDLNTYFIGYPLMVWPDTGLIHPQFNTCLTVTGRLSSSAPK